MTMVIFFHISVERGGGGHGKEGVWPSSSKGAKEHDHGHLLPFFSRDLLRWSWHVF